MAVRDVVQAAAGALGGDKLYVEDVFSTYLYTGNGSTQTITNGIDLDGEGGLVWVKKRSAAESHFLVNRNGFRLETNNTNAEGGQSVLTLGSSGFNLLSGNGAVNGSGSTYASWTFRKAEKFFDVVTWTGNGTSQSINHNLGSTPGCIIVKGTSGTGRSWIVWHRSFASTTTGRLILNTTDAYTTSSTYWNSTAPTSTQFTVGSNVNCNASGETFVAYLFAHDAGGFGDSGEENVISCGSYTGNGSTTGPVINLGWEPQWLMIKNASDSTNWLLFDTMRGIPTGSADALLLPNSSDAETANPNPNLDITATGFYTNSTSNTINASGNTYIYIAIRRGPMKTPESGTEVFEPFVDRTSIANKTNGTMGPVDMTMQTQVSSPLAGYNWSTFDRLRGANKYLQTDATAAETTATSVSFDVNGGVKNATWFSAGGVGYNFKRAPGFFDVVCYTGTGSNRTVSHTLGVAPELMIIKSRSASQEWTVYSAPTGNTKFGYLNYNSLFQTNSSAWNNTSPTSSVFTVGTGTLMNSSGYTYVAYLFATCPGVSKVGSYTGTGTTQQINCGFSSGARFVMVKTTSTTGNWIVVDTARGLVSGNDPTLALNSTAAEVTTNDWFDPYSAGFELSSASGNLANTNGVSYIFLAIS